MGPNERREKILETLCRRRHEKMANLSSEFGVCIRTIKNDIEYLSLSYPLKTLRGRYNGGVRVMDGFYLERKYLNPEQQELLKRLRVGLSSKDHAIMNSIFKDFALNGLHGMHPYTERKG